MSNPKKTNELNISAFKTLDVVVYALILSFFVFTLFLFIVIPKTERAEGFTVSEKGTLVLTFKYDGKTYEISSGYKDKITVDTEKNEITVKSGNDGTHFNVLAFDTESRSVWVSDSNCSASKDCVYSPKISGKSGAIYCLPHDVKILPIGGGKIPPVTG